MEEVLEYYIHPKFAKKRRLLVQIDGVWYDLKGSSEPEKIPDTADGPQDPIKVKGADQSLLKELLDNPKKYGNYSRLIKTRPTTQEALDLIAEEAILNGDFDQVDN